MNFKSFEKDLVIGLEKMWDRFGDWFGEKKKRKKEKKRMKKDFNNLLLYNVSFLKQYYETCVSHFTHEN